MNFVEEIYAAAEAAGLLITVTVNGQPVAMDFCAPGEGIFGGMVESTDYSVRYPTSWATLRQGEIVSIGTDNYKVRDAVAIGNGDEMRATLGKL